jgi:DNA replication and repair protein RecF
MGVERSRSALIVHFNGENVRRLSDLAGNFPVLVLSADNTNIFNGGPRFRRQTLDWALFHVEHNYRELWQRYSRILRQRNASLKSHSMSRLIRIWDEELIDAAVEIDRLRSEYLGEFSILLQHEMESLLPDMEVVLRYQAGWPANSTLKDALYSCLEKDRAYGFTQFGVHRSDFQLMVNNFESSMYCSRGQQKTLLVAFLLAQIRLQQSRHTPLGSLLLDDLSSELDESAQQRVLQALRELGIQTFVSQIAGNLVDRSGWSDVREFHVEHGVINEVL